VLCAAQDSASFLLDPAASDARHAATGKEVLLRPDNGPCRTSTASRAALAARERAGWLHVTWLATDCPHLNRQEPAWRRLKRDARAHPAPDLRAFADGLLDGLRQLGGERVDVVDHVPDWFLAGHRRQPTGRPPGRPKAVEDSYQRSYRRRNLPADT
jgi:hypothetical protein